MSAHIGLAEDVRRSRTRPSSIRALDIHAFDSPVALLRKWVDASPHAPAVVSDTSSLTSSQLWDSASRIARHLGAAGVRAGSCVGLYLEPSAALVEAVWGALGAGAGYLPLSPDYPDARTAFMAADSEVPVILTTARLAARLKKLAPDGVAVLVMEELGSEGPATDPDPDPDPDTNPDAGTEADAAAAAERGAPACGLVDDDPGAVAYTIYTSGSTGRPKGVLIEKRSIAYQMAWISRSGLLPAGSRILQKTPSSFDAAQWEILAGACGATVVVPPRHAFRDPEALAAAVRRHGVTALQCVPTMWRALSEGGLLTGCTTLTHLFSGGELLTTALAGALRTALPAARLVNLYGPTEATINCAWEDVTDEVVAGSSGGIPVGRPVDGMELLVLDEQLRPVSGEEMGELYVAGPQLARGYLHHEEMTAERFLTWDGPGGPRRLYRTGDLMRRDDRGALVFAGRKDHQVKINGHRIELDEVRLAIAEHHWVRETCVVPWTSERTGATQIAAFVELDPDEAALMDQGQSAAHHQSKHSRVQVRAQLSDGGVPTAGQLDGRPELPLPGAEPTGEQTAAVFRRKTYRFYEGTDLDSGRLTRLLDDAMTARRPATAATALNDATLGRLLRWFGPFHSTERLLPKYAYASPGALNATQIHLEVGGTGAAGGAGGIEGIAPGRYYFHPLRHTLVRLGEASGTSPGIRLHLIGKRSAIESVYATNVDEVLHFEAGHLLGVLDHVLPGLGLSYRTLPPDARTASWPPGDPQDHVALAAVDLLCGTGLPEIPAPQVQLLLQVHRDRVDGLAPGLYEVTGDGLVPQGTEVIRRKDVIAINQGVYERSAFGVSMVCRRALGWTAFVELGRMLQRLQTNDHRIGLMSSGYSSLTGRDLPSARRLNLLRGGTPETLTDADLSYFALGGPISPEQQTRRDMSEDRVHMRGPAEILKDELVRFLPQYMLPARIDIVAELPKTANGKCDVVALTELVKAKDELRPLLAPRTMDEAAVTGLWSELLGVDEVSVDDDFFASGGNSLLGVALINRINARFGTRLPVQAIFDAPTPQALAAAVDADEHRSQRRSRLIALSGGSGRPVYAWPGLGGFPMNLRPLAAAAGQEERPFVGVQAHGINPGESPYETIEQMAAGDIEQMFAEGAEGPFTLVGYSFGARVAFETAYQLEAAGHVVDRLVLIAPGSPRTALSPDPDTGARAAFDDPYFLQILLSVFTGSVDDEETFAACREQVDSLAEFCAFVAAVRPELTRDLVERITRVVMQTFDFQYRFTELDSRCVSAPISLIKAAGDDYSFIESRDGYAHQPPTVTELEGGHYAILRDPGLQPLAAAVRAVLAASGPTTSAPSAPSVPIASTVPSPASVTSVPSSPSRRSDLMPHINIKHFPLDLDDTARASLVDELTDAVARTFGCAPSVISIALEPVPEQDWASQVYGPEIAGRPELLCKAPEYSMPAAEPEPVH